MDSGGPSSKREKADSDEENPPKKFKGGSTGEGGSTDDGRSSWELDGHNGLLWSRDLENHCAGVFSTAIIQSDYRRSTHSQVECSDFGTYVGIYDGHGPTDVFRLTSEEIFQRFLDQAQSSPNRSADMIRLAISAIENEVHVLVNDKYPTDSGIAASGCSCLIGVIWEATLFVANVGDARVIVGSGGNSIVAKELVEQHSASRENIRNKLKVEHSNDPEIVVELKTGWYIKGVSKVSRAIGDLYLKMPKMQPGDEYPMYQFSKPIEDNAILSAEPSLYCGELTPDDKFIVFASGELWEHLSDDQVVNTVQTNSRAGIAKRLINIALESAAIKKKSNFESLKIFPKGIGRRAFHEDISVVVIYLDGNKVQAVETNRSVQGFCNSNEVSKFNNLKGIS